MQTESQNRRWTIVGLLFVAGFLNYQDRSILSIALPSIGREFHLDPAAKGVLLSAFFWSYALMQLPMGWWTDRHNLRWFYALAFSAWSITCGLTAFATSVGILIVLRAALGISESIYLPGAVKAVSVLFKAGDRGLASGLVNSGTRAGLALGIPMTATLILRFGWRATFAILGFTSLLWLVPWLTLFPRSANVRLNPVVENKRILSGPMHSLVGLCLGHVAFSYYWYLLVTWLPDYLVESRHLSLGAASVAVIVPYSVFTLSEPLGGWVADRLIRSGRDELRVRKGLITLAFFTSLALLLPDYVRSDRIAILMLALGSMVGLSTGNILALIQRLAPHESVGMWMGTVNFSGNLSGIIAPLITGILISRTHSYTAGFAVAVGILLLGLPAYWLLVTPARHVRPVTAAEQEGVIGRNS